MYELDRGQSVASESAILVRVILPQCTFVADPLAELEGLAKTAGVSVASRLIQRREKPDAATYLGKGKVEELKNLAACDDADVVIFDNDLSPAPDAQSGKGASTSRCSTAPS